MLYPREESEEWTLGLIFFFKSIGISPSLFFLLAWGLSEDV
jgi:hypothetical protein